MQGVRLSLTTQERVLLHLLRFYNIKGEYVVPEGVTQQGIADAVGTSRSNLPQTLKKLLSQGLLEQSTGRVEKIGSKRTVYMLSPTGIQQARKIRESIMQLKVIAVESEPGRIERKKREFALFDLYNYLEGKYSLLEIIRHTEDGNVDIDSLKNKDIPAHKKLTPSRSYAPVQDEKGIQASASKAIGDISKKEYGSVMRTESYELNVETTTGNGNEGANVQKSGSRVKEYIDETSSAPKMKHFFGRDKELDALRRWMESDLPRIMVIHGIAGIGKTTLVLKLMEEYKGKTNEYWFRCHEWDTLKTFLLPLSQFLGRLDRKGLGAYIQTHESIDISEVAHILEAELANLEALFVIDDFHNVKEAIVQLFMALVEILERVAGVKVLVNSRYTRVFYDRRDVAVRKTVSEMPLTGLDRESSREMLLNRGVTEELVNTIYKLTDGHPLSMELVDPHESLERQSDIKRYIYEEILSKLSPEEETTLAAACVFTYPMSAKALMRVEGVSHKTIDKLVEKSFLQEVSYETYDMHDMIKEFFYERLSMSDVKKYHESAARYYKSEYEQDKSGTSCMEAIHHFMRAEMFLEASELAVENDETLIQKGFLEELLQITESLDANKAGKFYPYVLAIQGDMLSVWGDWDKALKAFMGALESLEAVAGTGCDISTMNRETRTWAGRIHNNLGTILVNLGNLDEAIAHHSKALEFFASLGAMREMAKTYNSLGVVKYRKGDWEGAQELYQKALATAKASNDMLAVAKSSNNLGLIHWEKGELERAIDNYERAIELFEESGDKVNVAIVYNNMGDVYRDKNEYEKSIEFFEMSLQLSRRLRDRQGVARVYKNLGETYRRLGELPKAIEYGKKSLEILQKLGDKQQLAEVHCLLGQCLMDASGLEHLKLSLELFTSIGAVREINKTKEIIASRAN